MLIIEVAEIKGKCPVYKKGDKIVVDGPEIVLEKTDAICIHALASLLHYVVALREGVTPAKLGLSKSKDENSINNRCKTEFHQVRTLIKGIKKRLS